MITPELHVEPFPCVWSASTLSAGTSWSFTNGVPFRTPPCLKARYKAFWKEHEQSYQPSHASHSSGITLLIPWSLASVINPSSLRAGGSICQTLSSVVVFLCAVWSSASFLAYRHVSFLTSRSTLSLTDFVPSFFEYSFFFSFTWMIPQSECEEWLR